MGDTLTISFPGSSTAEGNRYAGSLSDELRGIDPAVSVDRLRESPATLDFGATLAVVLGTVSVTAVANGVASWLARHSGARIEIKKNGSDVATDLDSRDAARIAEAFSRRK